MTQTQADSDFSKFALITLCFLHVTLGILLVNSELLAEVFGVVPTLLICCVVIVNRNRNDEAFLGCMYIVGAEVTWRITEGYLSYEFAKHSVTIILLLGKLSEEKQISWNKGVLIYVASFIPGIVIAWSLLPDKELVRQLSSILSGPACLTAAAIYFSNRAVSYATFIRAIQIYGFTMVTLVVILYLKNPDLEAITYRSQSNFATSGGFGPNQVSTVLGMGIVFSTILLWFRKRITGFLITDVILLTLIIFRGFLTFSRGGMLGAAAAVLLFFLVISISGKTISFGRLISFISIGLVLFYALWTTMSEITEGQITNRYTGKDSLGRPIQNITSGRSLINLTELDLFVGNPLLGVGISYSKFIRKDQLDLFANTHNEFTRTLAEQGAIGIIGLFSLLVIAMSHYRSKGLIGKSIYWSFIPFFIITLLHSAMRISLVGLLFGICLGTLYTYRKSIPDRSVPSQFKELPVAI